MSQMGVSRDDVAFLWMMSTQRKGKKSWSIVKYIVEIRRKDHRCEKPHEYWIYWKSIDNIRKKLSHAKITRASGSVLNALLTYGGIISHAKNNKLLNDCKSVATIQTDLPVRVA